MMISSLPSPEAAERTNECQLSYTTTTTTSRRTTLECITTTTTALFQRECSYHVTLSSTSGGECELIKGKNPCAQEERCYRDLNWG